MLVEPCDGPPGWQDSHIRWLLRLSIGIKALVAAGSAILCARLPVDILDLFKTTYVTSLAVRPGKVRGIAPGERLAFHVIDSVLRPQRVHSADACALSLWYRCIGRH